MMLQRSHIALCNYALLLGSTAGLELLLPFVRGETCCSYRKQLLYADLLEHFSSYFFSVKCEYLSIFFRIGCRDHWEEPGQASILQPGCTGRVIQTRGTPGENASCSHSHLKSVSGKDYAEFCASHVDHFLSMKTSWSLMGLQQPRRDFG